MTFSLIRRSRWLLVTSVMCAACGDDEGGSGGSSSGSAGEGGNDAPASTSAQTTSSTQSGSGGGGGEPGYDSCNADSIRAALATAEEGDTVSVGACVVVGPFVVPAGVTFEGVAASATTVVGETGIAVSLEGGAAASVVRRMLVTSADEAAIVLRSGDATVEDVVVDVSSGLGIGVESANTVTIRRASVSGPIDSPAEAHTVMDPNSYGIALVSVGAAQLEEVSVEGFASMGVLAFDTPLDWAGGSTRGNAGTGLYIEGADATLTDLDISGSLQGMTLDEDGEWVSPYGAVFVDGHIDAVGLTVEDNAGTGILHLGASGTYADFVGSGNGADDTSMGAPAMWIQDAPFFELDQAFFDANAFAALVVAGSVAGITERVLISNTIVNNTRLATRPLGPDAELVEAGDGIMLVQVQNRMEFRNVFLDENERAGLVIDLDIGDVDAILFPLNRIQEWQNVFISGSGAQVGAVCQGEGPNKEVWGPDRPIEDTTWDDGIVRADVIVANDALLNPDIVTEESVDPLKVGAAVYPCTAPQLFGGGDAALESLGVSPGQ